MAVMYPKNIELYNATLSERIVYKALQEQLPDRYSVFYSVQWVDNINGKRKESECDFLIFDEQEGFLTCEVKGGKGYGRQDDTFLLKEEDGVRLLKRSPMAQSEESSRYFFNLYSKVYNDRFNGTYGSITLFPFYSIDDPVLLDHRPKEVVLDCRDMQDLYRKIKTAFVFYRSFSHSFGALTKNQRANFKNLINRQIAAQAAAGAIIAAKEYELENLNRIQDNFVFFLKYYLRTFITGGAGTGKTWIAFKFAKQALLNQKKVLITTFNKQLTHMFRLLLDGYANVTILSYEELLARDGIIDNELPGGMIELYSEATIEQYDAIIVDEAQDFDREQAQIISLHLQHSEDAELRVFYDFTQNMTGRNFQDGFPIHIPPFVLRENLRNTSSIYDWATEKTHLGREVVTNQIIGPLPVSYTFIKDYEARQYIETELLRLVDEDMVPLASIVILSDHECYKKLANERLGRWYCSNSMHSTDYIRLFTVEEFKGLEANVVFYYHEISTPEVYDYVAFTRAKYYLYEIIKK